MRNKVENNRIIVGEKKGNIVENNRKTIASEVDNVERKC